MVPNIVSFFLIFIIIQDGFAQTEEGEREGEDEEALTDTIVNADDLDLIQNDANHNAELDSKYFTLSNEIRQDSDGEF